MKRTLATLLFGALIVPAAACGGAARLPEGASYLPADTSLAISLNLPELVSTDLYRELQQRGGAVAMNRLNLEKFAKAAGIDAARDVRTLVFVGRPHAGAQESERPIDELSAVVSGTFDGKKVYRTFKDSGLPAEDVMGTEIFPIVVVDGRCRFCVTVLDDTTAAFGDGGTLRAMAEARNAPEKALAADPVSRRLLSRLDPKAAIWGVVRGKDLSSPLLDLLGRLGTSPAGSRPPAPVTDLAFFLSWRQRVTLAVDAVSDTEENAMLVADVLEGAGAMGKLALKQVKPDAADLLTTFRVQVDGRFLRASTDVPAERVMGLVRGTLGELFDAAAGMRALTGAAGEAGTPAGAEPPAPAAPPPGR